MRNRKVVFDKPNSAMLVGEDSAAPELDDDGILLRTECSLISPGTELAVYRGTESWAPLPFNPGYAAVGRIEALGDRVESLAVGDLLLTHSPHSRYSVISDKAIHVKLREDCDCRRAVFTRLASVSISALRISDVELGDTVAVLGMGLIGNLAAQLFALSGADVVGVDVCEERLAIARACGIKRTVNPRETDLKDAVVDVDVTVEATGSPNLVMDALEITGKRGEVILLGSPRGECNGDIVALLNQVHLWNNGCVTLKGAHEWRYPKKPTQGCKHSIQRNSEIISRLIADERLKIDPLITHVLKPEEAQNAYQGLLNGNGSYLGVILDWSES